MLALRQAEGCVGRSAPRQPSLEDANNFILLNASIGFFMLLITCSKYVAVVLSNLMSLNLHSETEH